MIKSKKKASAKKKPSRRVISKTARKTVKSKSPNKTVVESDKTEKKLKSKKRRKSTYVKKGGNGGIRAGAGRKKGVTTSKAKRRTAGIADDLAASSKITPLSYMLDVLNETPDQLIKDHKDGKIDTAEFVIRFKALTDRRDWAAEKAAVYLHPRLSSITASITTPEHEQYVKEREVEIAKLLAAAGRKKAKPAK